MGKILDYPRAVVNTPNKGRIIIMTANIQQELNQIFETKGRAIRLGTLIQGYKLCFRTESKSENTIRIANTALTTLKGFLESREYPTDVTEIGVTELREFILHLQQVKAFEHHPYTAPQTKGLSGHAVNTYLRAIRAFWSWPVRLALSSTSSQQIRSMLCLYLLLKYG